MQLENANSSVATVSGLQVGTYVFTLTVKDERNLQSQSSVNVIVKEGTSLPLAWVTAEASCSLQWLQNVLERGGAEGWQEGSRFFAFLKQPFIESDRRVTFSLPCCPLFPCSQLTTPNG